MLRLIRGETIGDKTLVSCIGRERDKKKIVSSYMLSSIDTCLESVPIKGVLILRVALYTIKRH